MFVDSELERPLQAIAVWRPLSVAVRLLSQLVTILAIRDTGRSETIASGTPPGEAMTTPIEQITVSGTRHLAGAARGEQSCWPRAVMGAVSRCPTFLEQWEDGTRERGRGRSSLPPPPTSHAE